MSDTTDGQSAQLPTPDPALKRLDRLVGTWSMRGHLLGSDEETNLSPSPLPYRWDLQGDTLTISVSYGPLDASFEGRFSEDGNSFSGGWRPNPGADAAVNPPYDIGGTRLA